MKKLERFAIYEGVSETEGKVFRLSRWIKIKQNYNPNKGNSLWDYVNDGYGRSPYHDNFNPDEGLYLDYFTWNGQNYAINQFMAFGSAWDGIEHCEGYIENGVHHMLAGYDSTKIFNPLLIEVDENCEHVRLYVECR